MSSLFDDVTPREVWQEYTLRKRALEGREDYAEALEEVLTELGCGLPQGALTETQRMAQAEAVAKWREHVWPGIDPVRVRLLLGELDQVFAERVASACSGTEQATLVEEWATRSARELEGLDTDEAQRLRAIYRAIAHGAGP